MLTHVRIDNFKCFKTVELDLSPMTVLMGENGSGKTTVLQAIALAARLFSRTDLLTVERETGEIRVRPTGKSLSSLPGLHVDDPADLFHGKRARGGAGGGTTAIDIILREDSGNTYRLRVTSQYGGYNAKCISKSDEMVASPALALRPALLISGFVGIPATEERLFQVAIEERIAQGRASDILRNILFDIRNHDEDRFRRLVELVKTYFDFDLGQVSFDGAADLHIHASYKEKSDRRWIDLDLTTAGSGFLQALQIIGCIYRFADSSSVLLLDEPDAHLHPNLQRTMARVLKEVAAEESLQIILSTHSTAIIREMDAESVIPVTAGRRKLQSLRTPADVEGSILAQIDSYSAAEASIHGRVLFVEDKNKRILKKVDELLDLRLFQGLGAAPVLSAQGKDDKVPFRIGEVLSAITGKRIRVAFIRDSDGLTQQWIDQLTAHAEGCDVRLFMLPVHEAENLLLNVGTIHRAAEGNLDRGTIEEALLQACRDVIALARFSFDKLLRDNIYKTQRLLGNDGSYADAEREAGEIRASYEGLTDLAELVRVVPGKECLTELVRRLKDDSGVQVTRAKLVRSLELGDLSEERRVALRGLKDLWT